MQLNNPVQQRALNEVLVSLPAAEIAKVAPSLAKLEALLQRQHQRDTEIVQAIIRVLRHPAHQRLAEELRNLILKGTNQ